MDSSLLNNDAALSEVVRFRRERPPSDYLLRIESFSLLQKSLQHGKEDAFESSKFVVQGFTWVLRIYPNGNKINDGEDHLSFSIKMVDAHDLGGIVTCAFKFFIYDHKQDNYLVLQNMHEKSFYALKEERGISRALKLTTLTDASQGFLVNDCCLFGVEISVVNSGIIAASSLLQNKLSSPCSYTWKIPCIINSISDHLNIKCVTSPEFTIGDFLWKLHVYPTEINPKQGQYLYLFLYFLSHDKLACGQKLLADCELCLKDQLKDSKNHKRTTSARFDSSSTVCGFLDFLLLTELHSPSSSFISNNSLTVEVTIKSMFVLSDLKPISAK